MPLVVEDGTGLATANSYADQAFASLYWQDLGEPSSWTSETRKDGALMIATRFIETTWGCDFEGTRLLESQALRFPTQGFTDRLGRVVASGEVPLVLKQATVILANEHSANGLYLDQTSTTAGGQVTKKRVKLDVLEEETVYASGSTTSLVSGVNKRFPEVEALIEALLSPFASGGGSSDWTYRA